MIVKATLTRHDDVELNLPDSTVGAVGDAHAAMSGNPHGVTAADVGADPAGTAAGLISALTPATIGAAPTVHPHDIATTTAPGFLSPGDKAKLANVPANTNTTLANLQSKIVPTRDELSIANTTPVNLPDADAVLITVTAQPEPQITAVVNVAIPTTRKTVHITLRGAPHTISLQAAGSNSLETGPITVQMGTVTQPTTVCLIRRKAPNENTFYRGA